MARPALAGPKEAAGTEGRGPADCEPFAVADVPWAHSPKSLRLRSCRNDYFFGGLEQLWLQGPVVDPSDDVGILGFFDGLARKADASRSKDATESRRHPREQTLSRTGLCNLGALQAQGQSLSPHLRQGHLVVECPAPFRFRSIHASESSGCAIAADNSPRARQKPRHKNSYRAHIMRRCAFSTRRLAKLPPSFRSFLEPDRKADPLTVRRLESQAQNRLSYS